MFIVTDSKNASSELHPIVQLCPCTNGSICIDDDDVHRQRDSGTRFILLSCACPTGLTGQYCENIIDACWRNIQPCYPGVKCTDLRSSSNGTGYQCGPCPAGYSGDGTVCDGKSREPHILFQRGWESMRLNQPYPIV